MSDKLTITELINKLQKAKEEYGDIPVGYYWDGIPTNVKRVNFESAERGQGTETDYYGEEKNLSHYHFGEDTIILE